MAGRYFVVKRLPFQRTWEEHLAEFKETQRIVRILETFDEKESWHRILVPRVMGLEDRSRLWSPRMVVERLEIVEGGISRVIQGLLGKGLSTAIDIATLKPSLGSRTGLRDAI